MSDLLSDAPSPLDAAIGLEAVELLDDGVVLRLDARVLHDLLPEGKIDLDRHGHFKLP